MRSEDTGGGDPPPPAWCGYRHCIVSSNDPTRRSVAVVSSSRADLAHLIHPLRALQACPTLDLEVLATGAMLQDEYGRGVDRLHEEGFTVREVGGPLEIERGVDAARAIGSATTAFAEVLDDSTPDLLMVIADRFEMLAPANAALAMRTPIVHVEGGERSEGAIDDAVRNALTKLSHLHLVTTSQARRRVLAMGEEPWRVHQVGAASLDHLRSSRIPERPELDACLGLDGNRPLLLVGMHPVTLATDPLADTVAVLSALEDREEALVFCFPNADEGGRAVRDLVDDFVQSRQHAHLFTNLAPETWFGLLHSAEVIIGNSSSVVMESPSIPLPAICVGDRQAGRERASNVIDAAPCADEIARALEAALGMPRLPIESPYGDGHASERILAAILDAPGRESLLLKRTTILDDAGIRHHG
ncbi:MAG: UDP-N-acetylglucosamine 2-epimerase [Phycisphaerales bacterium]|nr:UDP-N-acetylglucosamine 2-epimerase [Phycisphaerales bacterium]